MRFYVYAFYEPGSNNPFYIGKGSGSRAWNHFTPTNLKKKTLFYKTLRSLLNKGLIPKVKVLKRTDDEYEAFAYEIEMIAKYGRLDKNTGCLCNHTDGGEGFTGSLKAYEGHSHTVETRTKMTLSYRQVTLATRAKSKKTHRERYGVAVESYDLEFGFVIKRYEALNAVRDDNHDPRAVLRVIKKQYQHHHEMGWRYS